MLKGSRYGFGHRSNSWDKASFRSLYRKILTSILKIPLFCTYHLNLTSWSILHSVNVTQVLPKSTEVYVHDCIPHITSNFLEKQIHGMAATAVPATNTGFLSCWLNSKKNKTYFLNCPLLISFYKCCFHIVFEYIPTYSIFFSAVTCTHTQRINSTLIELLSLCTWQSSPSTAATSLLSQAKINLLNKAFITFGLWHPIPFIFLSANFSQKLLKFQFIAHSAFTIMQALNSFSTICFKVNFAIKLHLWSLIRMKSILEHILLTYSSDLKIFPNWLYVATITPHLEMWIT